MYLEIEKVTGVTEEEIKSKSRKAEIVLARKILCYYLRRKKEMTLQAIALEIYGVKKRHDVVVSNFNSIVDLFDSGDSSVIKLYDEFSRLMNQEVVHRTKRRPKTNRLNLQDITEDLRSTRKKILANNNPDSIRKYKINKFLKAEKCKKYIHILGDMTTKTRDRDLDYAKELNWTLYGSLIGEKL